MQIFTIYRATCTVNGKSYIGFSSKWPDRVKEHNDAAKAGSAFLFHKAIRKHGFENFVWEILYQSKECDYTLNEMEPYFIDECNTFFGTGDGYNMTLGGEGAFGVIRSQETRDRMKAAWKKRAPMSDETRAKIGAASLGRSPSPETRSKIAESNRGKIISPETRAKLSAINTGKPSHSIGYNPSQETREKMAAAKRGKKRGQFSAETRQKMSDARKNLSSETREKLSIAAREAHVRKKMINQEVRI